MATDSQLIEPQFASSLNAIELSTAQFGSGNRFTKILLLDGYSTRTLACVRSWGKKGIAFAVGGETRWDMSLLSRYAKEKFVYTSAKRDVLQFIRDVNYYCRVFKADGVFPTSEAAIMVCNGYRKDLECEPIVPRQQQIQIAFNKARTLEIAESLGIPVPETVYLTGINSQSSQAVAMKFPLIVKSESSESMTADRVKTSAKTSLVFSRRELQAQCSSRLAEGQSVLIQEFIDGYGVGVSGLFDKGEPIVLIGHRRLRESTPWGGPSALAETIEISSELRCATLGLMKEIGFTGPAMAEYKIDWRSGRPYLMEINGRFWGSVLLGNAAGLDLPYLYWKMLNRIEVQPEEKRYRVGVRGRYLVGDTKSLLLSLRGKPKGWPGQIARRSSALKSYLCSFFDPNSKELILELDDPMPFLGRLMQSQF